MDKSDCPVRRAGRLSFWYEIYGRRSGSGSRRQDEPSDGKADAESSSGLPAWCTGNRCYSVVLSHHGYGYGFSECGNHGSGTGNRCDYRCQYRYYSNQRTDCIGCQRDCPAVYRHWCGFVPLLQKGYAQAYRAGYSGLRHPVSGTTYHERIDGFSQGFSRLSEFHHDRPATRLSVCWWEHFCAR